MQNHPQSEAAKANGRTQADLQAELVKLEEQERELELPFLYGWKWYPWARAFYESQNKFNLLCAANQISKSSTQIRKCINWATDQKLWPELWARKPIQFWYCYPTQKQVNAEFETKWKLFLPSGEMRDDTYYGWKPIKKGSDIIGIEFFSGVFVYFKTYSQNVQALQTGTVDALFVDEELPMLLYPELVFRLAASNGYFNMVFTATLGQDEWRLALEPLEAEEEFLPDAFKQTVSLYDSQFFEDGSPSHWTTERIRQIEAACKSTAEIEKRVHGRFILAGGRKYEEFDVRKHVKEKHFIPATWHIYAGADPGSGGPPTGQGSPPHYPSLVYVAVSPDYRRGRIFLGWLGDDGRRYTAGDLVEKHLEIKKEHKLKIMNQWYDQSSRDFFEIASRNSEHFEKAEKRHDIGVPIVNTLFKYGMLTVYDDVELRKLTRELSSLKAETLKRNADDNFCDALRYCVAKIPWDFSVVDQAVAMTVREEPLEPLTAQQQEIFERRKAFDEADEREEARVQSEFEEWNEFYGN